MTWMEQEEQFKLQLCWHGHNSIGIIMHRIISINNVFRAMVCIVCMNMCIELPVLQPQYCEDCADWPDAETVSSGTRSLELYQTTWRRNVKRRRQ